MWSKLLSCIASEWNGECIRSAFFHCRIIIWNFLEGIVTFCLFFLFSYCYLFFHSNAESWLEREFLDLFQHFPAFEAPEVSWPWSEQSIMLQFSSNREFSNCRICNQAFTNPKVLPCSHTFCEHCLREFVTSRSYDAFACFPCPVCQLHIAIPPGGVHHLSDLVVLSSSPSVPSVEPFRPDNWVQVTAGMLSFGCFGGKPFDFSCPVGLDVSRKGYIIISDKRGNRILKFDFGGNLKMAFSCQEQINNIVLSENDTVFASNSQPGQPLALEYSLAGSRLGFNTINRLESTQGITILRKPFQVVVASVETSTIYILNENGKISQKLCSRGTYGQPYHLCSNSKNQIIISDHLNHFIKVFTRLGKCKVKFGGSGMQMNQLYQPLGICVDEFDNIIVADSGNRCVKLFSSAGQFVKILVNFSSSSSEIILKPVNVALSQELGKLVVMVTGHDFAQIQIFQYIAQSFIKSTTFCLPMLKL